MTITEIMDELKRARQDVKRTERAYSVCLLTDSACRNEQREYQRACKRLKELEHKLKMAQRARLTD